MISGRRAAREVALLILFAGEMNGVETHEEVLATFRDDLRDDDEILVDLFGRAEQRGFTGLLSRARETLDVDGAHWLFVERLVRGVDDHRHAIDDLVGRSSLNWKVSRMGAVDRNVLRLAAYELAFEPDVPSKATLNEAIEIAKRYGSEDSGKFVNGILDRIAQELGRV